MADTDREGLGRPDRRTHYYYDSAWRLLEERIDPGYDATWSPPPPEGTGQSGTPPPWDWNDLTNTFAGAFDPGRNRRTGRQYIWDPTASGGGDELLQFRTAAAPTFAGGELLFDKSWWSLTDRMGSVLGLVADSASGGGADWTPSERVEYSPYGRPRTMPRADASGNGTVDFADISAIYASYGKTLTQPGYKARADLSADGAVGYSDISAVWASWGQAEQIDTLWSSGFEGASGGGGAGASGGGVGHGCDIGYAGALWDPDLGLWQMRRRCYDPVLGRWLTRDPAGYVDGMSLYEYVGSRPLMYYDPFGLASFVRSWFAGVSAALRGVADAVASQQDPLGRVQTYAVETAAQRGLSLVGGVASLAEQAVAVNFSGDTTPLGAWARDTSVIHQVANSVADQGLAATVEPMVDAAADYGRRVASGDLEAIGDGFNAFGQLTLAAAGGLRLMGEAGEAVQALRLAEGADAAEGAVAAETRGGAYLLRDYETGQVMRTGRTNDLLRRQGEHFRDPLLTDYDFEPIYRTDNYFEQRGLEQLLHDQYGPPLNNINPISSRNPSRQLYLDAARQYLDRQACP